MLRRLLSVFKFIISLIVISIAGAIGRDIGEIAFSSSKPSPQEIEAALMEGDKIAASKINQQTPIMVDKDTRLDRATAGSGMRLVYHYTFPSYTSKDIDANFFRTNFWPKIKSKVCSNEKMKPALQLGNLYVYSYSSSDGVEVGRFEIGRNDCGFSKISVVR
jgi:hypothetical protein